MTPLFIDLETRSPVNLKTDGGQKYAAHPATSILTAVWMVDGVYGIWFPTLTEIPLLVRQIHLQNIEVFLGAELPKSLADNLHRPWVAHNAWGFDQPVWEAKHPAPIDWIDSYPLALQIGLPGSLDEIGKRLGVGGKEQTGKSVLGRYTKNFAKVPNMMDTVLIGKYAIHDVEIMAELYQTYKDSPQQPKKEYRALEAHRTINHRGCRVDVSMMRAIRDLMDYAVADAVSEIAVMTDGYLPDLKSLGQRGKVVEWMQSQGVMTDKELGRTKTGGISLAKNSVQQWLDRAEAGGLSVDELIVEGDFNARGIKLLQLRNAATRVTGGKIDAGLARAMLGRINGLFAYWAAHTGRWGGRGIQVQNLPRPKETVPVWDLVNLFVATGRLDPDTVRTMLEAKYQSALKYNPHTSRSTLDDAASALLRTIFLGDPMLAMADYSAIECRMLGHLAGQESLVQMFWNDVCPYSDMARRIYDRAPLDKKDPIRQVGKVVVLGAGYQLGHKKFGVYALANGIDLSKAGTTAEQCIEAFRGAFPEIAGHEVSQYNGKPVRRHGLWHRIDEAAKQAMEHGKSACGDIRFHYDGDHLRCRLPSGRFLTYRNARMDMVWPAYETEQQIESITYFSSRGYRAALYGGKLCWGANTKVMTARGTQRIVDVVPGDLVFDGTKWVKTSGVIHQGRKEVVSWLGNQVTADHLIFDGEKWNPVTHLTDRSVVQSLKWAHGSVVSWLSMGEAAKVRSLLSSVHSASELRTWRLGVLCEKRLIGANIVDLRERRQNGNDMQILSQINSCEASGRTDIQEWCHDVLTQNTEHTRTMEEGVSQYMLHGSKIVESFLSTPKPSKTGMFSDSTWTGKITTETTSPETSDWLPVQLTQEIDVYDLQNCGDRRAFMVLTGRGPVLSHNCENVDQAACRDLIAEAMVELEDENLPVSLHVHDEAVVSVQNVPDFERFMSIFTKSPKWLKGGFPIDAEGGILDRYHKSIRPGSEEVVFRNGAFRRGNMEKVWPASIG